MKVDIGKAIMRGLEKKNLKKNEFAKIIGKSHSAVSEWTNNKKHPSAECLIEIASILEIQDDLFPRSESKIEAPENPKLLSEEVIRKIIERVANLEKVLKNQQKNNLKAGKNAVGKISGSIGVIGQ